jgi:conjugative transposon TraM protein
MNENQGSGNEDPEMEHLNGMMDKILDIQHPERVKERIRQKSVVHDGQPFEIREYKARSESNLLVNNKVTLSNHFSTNQFYSLQEDSNKVWTEENCIPAIVDESQTVVSGSLVKLRLMNDVAINGSRIPKGTLLFGTGTLDRERLIVTIKSIRFKNFLFPVDLAVFDLDGIEGLYIPGAISNDVARQSADKAVQGIGLITSEQTLETQAASAGIEAAKTLLSKKAKLIKVVLKPGYQVLLRNKKDI